MHAKPNLKQALRSIVFQIEVLYGGYTNLKYEDSTVCVKNASKMDPTSHFFNHFKYCRSENQYWKQ